MVVSSQPLVLQVEPPDTPTPSALEIVSSDTSAAPSSGSNQPVKSVLESLQDGSRIEVWKFPSGSIAAKVLKFSAFGTERLLGEVKVMVDGRTGLKTLQGRCKTHSSTCMCWLSSTRHLDLLSNWIASGASGDEQNHQTMARELKRSIGMKVRG